MSREITPGRPTTRRYSGEEKEQGVRLVFQLCKELGTSQRPMKRVAEQLGYGAEPVRHWVRQQLQLGTYSPLSLPAEIRSASILNPSAEYEAANHGSSRSADTGGVELLRVSCTSLELKRPFGPTWVSKEKWQTPAIPTAS